MAMNKHQNNARSGKPYADQPTSSGTGGTRDKLSYGGHVGHESHGHKGMHETTKSHSHGHKHERKHGG